MKNKYIFDMDGTLTESRKSILAEHKEMFEELCKQHDVYIVTGSDIKKVEEQLGSNILSITKAVYTCSGATKFNKHGKVFESDWDGDAGLDVFLRALRENSKWPDERFTTDIEKRKGVVNFSVVGRDCTEEARQEYFKWDSGSGERVKFCRVINEMFPLLNATVGGQISIDIVRQGHNKSSVLRDADEFSKDNYIVFIGDRMDPNGNDYPLAKEISLNWNGTAIETDGPVETFNKFIKRMI